MWSPRRFNARDHEGVHRESTERTRSNRRVDGVNRLGAALVGAASVIRPSFTYPSRDILPFPLLMSGKGR